MELIPELGLALISSPFGTTVIMRIIAEEQSPHEPRMMVETVDPSHVPFDISLSLGFTVIPRTVKGSIYHSKWIARSVRREGKYNDIVFDADVCQNPLLDFTQGV